MSITYIPPDTRTLNALGQMSNLFMRWGEDLDRESRWKAQQALLRGDNKTYTGITGVTFNVYNPYYEQQKSILEQNRPVEQSKESILQELKFNHEIANSFRRRNKKLHPALGMYNDEQALKAINSNANLRKGYLNGGYITEADKSTSVPGLEEKANMQYSLQQEKLAAWKEKEKELKEYYHESYGKTRARITQDYKERLRNARSLQEALALRREYAGAIKDANTTFARPQGDRASLDLDLKRFGGRGGGRGSGRMKTFIVTTPFGREYVRANSNASDAQILAQVKKEKPKLRNKGINLGNSNITEGSRLKATNAGNKEIQENLKDTVSSDLNFWYGDKVQRALEQLREYKKNGQDALYYTGIDFIKNNNDYTPAMRLAILNSLGIGGSKEYVAKKSKNKSTNKKSSKRNIAAEPVHSSYYLGTN